MVGIQPKCRKIVLGTDKCTLSSVIDMVSNIYAYWLMYSIDKNVQLNVQYKLNVNSVSGSACARLSRANAKVLSQCSNECSPAQCCGVEFSRVTAPGEKLFLSLLVCERRLL